MKFFSFTLLVLSFYVNSLMNPATAEPAANDGELFEKRSNLQLTVRRIKQLTGTLHYQLLNCPEDETSQWSQLQIVQQGNQLVSKKDASLSIDGLLEGSYIIRVFQDMNKNQALDYSDNDIPKEPTGFSTNPSLILGEPVPFKTCFEFKNGSTVVINMNNKRKRNRRRYN